MAAKRKKPAPAQAGTTKTTPVQKKKPSASPSSGILEKYGTLLLLILLAFFLYGSSLRFGYVLDDEMVLHKNAFVQKGWAGIPDIFRHDSFLGFFQSKEQLYLLEGGRYRPLSLASFAAEVALFGPDRPGISHGINILLYALTAWLLFRIIRRLYAPVLTRRSFGFAALVALLWLLHPVHTEAVANIKGRDELFSLLFSLLALGTAMKYAVAGKWSWLLASSLLLFVALLSKESALTFLAIIPLTLWFFYNLRGKQLFRTIVPLLLASLVFILLRQFALGYFLDHGKGVSDLMNNPFTGMSGADKYATIVFTLGWYLKLLFFPHPLTHDYYPYHVPVMHWSHPLVWLSAAIYLFLFLASLYGLRKKNSYAYAGLFFLLALSIVSNLVVSVGTFMNERFLYAPSIAFCLALVYFLFTRFTTNKWQPVLAVLIPVCLFYGWKTLDRIPDWSDPLSLDRSAVAVSANSARAHCFFAVSLYTYRYTQTKDPVEQARLVDTMEYHLNKSLGIHPGYGVAYQMKTGVLGARYQLDKDLEKLLSGFEQVLRNVPSNKASVDFIKQYVDYLYPRNSERMDRFCYHMGYEVFFRQMKKPDMARMFIELGQKNHPSSPQLSIAAEELKKATKS